MAESVRQGEIYWIPAEALRPERQGLARPHLVIQDDVLNHSRLPTTVVVALFTKGPRFTEPGNVVLEAGEGGLKRASVAVVSQVSSVDVADLGERLGQVEARRVEQVLAGMRFQQRAFFER